MDPVSQFKFACPICGQHLEAGADEAGQTTECPSCFKKLTVPQAPTSGGSKLIITASLADTRRVPLHRSDEAPAPPVAAGCSSRLWLALLLVLLAAGLAAGAWYLTRRAPTQPPPEPSKPSHWTGDAQALTLLETPVEGQIKGWDFVPTRSIWQDTRLILRQDGGQPEALRLQVTFPLHGGELVPGKTFRLGLNDQPFEPPIRMLWKEPDGTEKSEPVGSKYLLWIEFDQVSKSTVGGRIHLCLADDQKSWVAGRFSARNQTKVK